MTTEQKANMTKAAAGAAGVYHANGFKLAPTAKSDNYKNYCFKCGKPKSEHKFLQGCPK